MQALHDHETVINVIHAIVGPVRVPGLLLSLIKIMAKSLKRKATVLWNGLPNILKKVSSIKKLLKKLKLFCGQQTPTVRISSLVYNVTNYYSVTDILLAYCRLFAYVASK